MRLPALPTSAVAVCLALVTAFGMTAVRTAAPRERDRAMRMTRGTGQRLDSGEAIHAHEDTGVAVDFSGEPESDAWARSDTHPIVSAILSKRLADLRTPVLPGASVPLPPHMPLPAALIPPVPGRAPPSL